MIDLPSDLNVALGDVGVPSLGMVSFARVVAREFNVSFSPEDYANLTSVQALTRYVDAQVG